MTVTPNQMKLPIGLLLLSCIAIPFGSQCAIAAEREEVVKDAAIIQVQNLCILLSGKVVLKCKNISGKPVKAFKGKWFAFDDFNEVSQSEDILFTSNTLVLGSNAIHASLGGYIIQPDGIIYLLRDGNNRFAYVGRLASEWFGETDKLPPPLKKRFKADITDVVFDSHHLEPAAPPAISPKRKSQQAAIVPAPVVTATESDAIPTPPAAPPIYVVVGVTPGDFLNVRSEPAMNSNAVFKLTNGDKVQVTGKSAYNGATEWIPITANSQKGWVRNKYLRLQSK